jgi:hypothetical protein
MTEEQSMEVLPLSAMPRYCDQMKKEGTSVEYYMQRLSDVPPAGILRLGELADRLSESRSMTFDERIRALQVTPRTASAKNREKILELLNTTLHHVLTNDVEKGKLVRDYTQFLVEYVDIVRDAGSADASPDNDGSSSSSPSSSSRAHTMLLSRAYRAIQIDARDSTNGEILETLNSMLYSTLAGDGGDDETSVVRDYSPFFVEYVQIVSDADELSPEDARGSRDLLLRAYKAASSTLRS